MAPVTVVISQSMYFPWVGLLEQVRLADVFVHYDDVQFARGFLNRVQIKTKDGPCWMTVPTRDRYRGQTIDEVLIDDSKAWRDDHRNQISLALRGAPFLDDALGLMDAVFDVPAVTLADISRASVRALARYFELDAETEFLNSRDMGTPGASSQRLKDLTLAAGGDVYLTGHGARNYLEHNRAAVEAHPMSSRITMLQGSSIDDDIASQVRNFASGYERVLVCLDSNHTHDHVLAELEAYGPLVTPGSYCIVMDTIVEDMPTSMFPDRPWGPGDNPKTAVHKWVDTRDDFEIDRAMDAKLQISVTPEGFLRRK